ncbi:MAG: glycosyltransferase family 4 protein [Rhizobiaceae bacterium]|nr:glycosyltransferase family 4 protein [Rhizobiaceae bacterium]
MAAAGVRAETGAGTAAPSRPDVAAVEVVAPNFKRRLSGVTSTIVQLVPLQARTLGVATLGPGLPDGLPKLGWLDVPRLWRRPARRPVRIWHARRNVEMIAGIVLRDVLRMPLRLLFTSAAQRDHKPLTKWLIRRMDAVVATSRRSGSFLEVPHRVVMHGIDLDRFTPPADRDAAFAASGLPGRHAVGCFGRVREQKGTDLFVDAMIALLPHFPDWTAIVSGRATAEHAGFAAGLEEKVRKAGLAERILFLGEVDDIRPWYGRVSLYVAPSRNEGFGLTPLEAMASGTPVVASDAGAYAELVVPGETGAVVPAGDGMALREAIRLYMADPAMARRHGEAGLAHVRAAFPLQREADALAAVYEAIWARGGGA